MTAKRATFYRFHIIPIKIQMAFFTELYKAILKFMWKLKRHQVLKAVSSKGDNTQRYADIWVQNMLQGPQNKSEDSWAQKSVILRGVRTRLSCSFWAHGSCPEPWMLLSMSLWRIYRLHLLVCLLRNDKSFSACYLVLRNLFQIFFPLF